MTKTAPGSFPADPIFTRLLQVAREITHVVVSDPHNGVEADYAQLLSDILQVQTDLLHSLPRSLFGGANFLQKGNPYIFLLSDGSYEAIVAAFAILSIGGAVVPLGAGPRYEQRGDSLI
jgi:acyl-CoA synthetase (AMP-forming)/AMP-acid ligase II